MKAALRVAWWAAIGRALPCARCGCCGRCAASRRRWPCWRCGCCGTSARDDGNNGRQDHSMNMGHSLNLQQSGACQWCNGKGDDLTNLCPFGTATVEDVRQHDAVTLLDGERIERLKTPQWRCTRCGAEAPATVEGTGPVGPWRQTMVGPLRVEHGCDDFPGAWCEAVIITAVVAREAGEASRS